MTGGSGRDYRDVALAFANALASRDYPTAYAMTSKEYQALTTIEAMRAAFERIVPTDWETVGPIGIGMAMESWPGKQPHDLGLAYVGIGGDVYSEAVTVVVTLEGGELKVRTVEFGRP